MSRRVLRVFGGGLVVVAAVTTAFRWLWQSGLRRGVEWWCLLAAARRRCCWWSFGGGLVVVAAVATALQRLCMLYGGCGWVAGAVAWVFGVRRRWVGARRGCGHHRVRAPSPSCDNGKRIFLLLLGEPVKKPNVKKAVAHKTSTSEATAF